MSHAEQVVKAMFVQINAEEVDAVVSRLTSVHPDACAAGEPCEYQLRGAGAISATTMMKSHFANKTIREIQKNLFDALEKDRGIPRYYLRPLGYPDYERGRYEYEVRDREQRQLIGFFPSGPLANMVVTALNHASQAGSLATFQ